VKTDSELQRDVMAELAWDPSIKHEAIGVAVKDGIVTLSGHIETYAEKHAIEKALRRVTGVQAIALELDVRLSPQHRRNDTELAAAVKSALSWNSIVPADKLRVTVDKGWVTLAGELDWDYQRRGAEKTVRALIGVVGLDNEITLKPRPTTAGVAGRIEDALKRQAEREAKRVQVEVAGSVVTLRGNVHSWQERDAAAWAAWAAPGVTSVVNEVRVGG
jgi:osmotically-inducible protein OsmY